MHLSTRLCSPVCNAASMQCTSTQHVEYEAERCACRRAALVTSHLCAAALGVAGGYAWDFHLGGLANDLTGAIARSPLSKAADLASRFGTPEHARILVTKFLFQLQTICFTGATCLCETFGSSYSAGRCATHVALLTILRQPLMRAVTCRRRTVHSTT